MSTPSHEKRITINIWPKENAEAVAFFLSAALVACAFFFCYAWTIVKELEYKSSAIQATAKAIESK